ncbi:MAG: tetratricopeptide repeat protein [Candidatus Obscuribacterales bacterium]|nr:tetratricopeptide repeat protein [Candidatus Obscuribacterales bacterium]
MTIYCLHEFHSLARLAKNRIIRTAAIMGYCTIALLCSSSVAQAQSQEFATLQAWKASARNSAVGNQLLAVLNAQNAALAVNPKNKNALYMRGYLFGIIGCTSSAIGDLSKAIELDPNFAAAYTERGICYMDLKNYDRAKVDLERAMRLAPDSGDARFAHGKLMLEQEKPSIASADFRSCQSGFCRFSPVLPGELPANYYNGPDYYLGVCDEMMGRQEEALKHYKVASRQKAGTGYIKRYSDQPLDASYRVSKLETGI